MDNPFSKTIVFNPDMTLKEKYERSMYIIGKYRSELPYLRRKISTLDKQIKKSQEEALYWRRKYEEEKEKSKKLDREVDKLKKEIDRLTKTNSRYQVALFDHGNFKSSTGKNKKEKGGQTSHPDTNREQNEDYLSFKRIRMFAKKCRSCNNFLPRVNAVKQKVFLDIVINPTIIKMILESERQWCSTCKCEINVKDKRTLPFTEYGINTFMMTMILRFKCHSSLQNIATVITISHGLPISSSVVSNLLKQAKIYLRARYQKLIMAIQKGSIMYNDETGWLVNGESAWMWIAANEKTTVYFAAESRGKGIMEEIYGKSTAYSMHDGLASYLKSIPADKHLYCWAHFLRFCFEETITEKKASQAVSIRNKIVDVYHLKQKYKDCSKKHLEFILTTELNKILKIQSENNSVSAIQKRLKIQKDGLVKALLYSPDGTNNLAERELRPLVINKKISYGSDTFSGMETTAILGSIIQTLSKTDEPLIPRLKQYLQEGIQKKYQQYFHEAYYDSS